MVKNHAGTGTESIQTLAENFLKPFRHRNMDLHLRRSNNCDIEAIRHLVNSAYKELADQGLNYTAADQDEQTTKERIQKGRAFVLMYGEKIIGTVLLSERNYFSRRRTAYVSQLAVSPGFKRLGLGSILMDWCECLAQLEGYEGVQLDTAKPATHLVGWYLKRKYAIVSETHWEGKTYDSWIFEKLNSKAIGAPGVHQALSLDLMPELLAVTRLEPFSQIPEWATKSPFFSVSRSTDELSIVCRQSDVPSPIKCNLGWRALKVQGPLDFSLTGILASITQPLAEVKISLFAISTFDTDYVLIKQDQMVEAIKALAATGHHVRNF